MSRTDEDDTGTESDPAGTPRALVHRRILDAAERDPDATLAEIADRVGGATVDLVDDVLAEYGDPAASGGDAGDESDADAADGADGANEGDDTAAAGESDSAQSQPSDATDGTDETADPDAAGALTDRQRETLRAVAADPDASQAAVADRLGVSRATVSRRLNGIPGFEWSDRAAFAARLLGAAGGDGRSTAPTPEATADGGTTQGAASEAPPTGDSADPDAGSEDTARTADAAADPDAAAFPPDLAHKIIHACIESDRLDEDEELRVIRAVVDAEGRHH